MNANALETRRRAIAALLALASACSSPAREPVETDQLAAELAAIAAVETLDRDEVAALLARSASLESRARQSVERWQASRRDFEQARQTYAASAATARDASTGFEAAIEDFQRAERQYRYAALAVILVAASSQLCATTTSTRAFRARLRADGIDLDGQDIDHIWPRSLGGADHPLNYQVLDAHINRSLGARVVDKFMAQPIAVVQGLVVSALTALAC
jgi:hypothetical protein